MQLGPFPLLTPSSSPGSLQQNGVGVNSNKECSNAQWSIHIFDQCYLKRSTLQKNETTVSRRAGQMTASHPLIVRHNGETHRQLGMLCVGERCHPGPWEHVQGACITKENVWIDRWMQTDLTRHWWLATFLFLPLPIYWLSIFILGMLEKFYDPSHKDIQ